MLDWKTKLNDIITEFITLKQGKYVFPPDDYIQDLPKKLHSVLESTLCDKTRKEDVGVINERKYSHYSPIKNYIWSRQRFDWKRKMLKQPSQTLM